MLFNKLKIYLTGGIGNQILQLLIQIEKALRKNISESNIEIIICKYDNSQPERLFHNSQYITNFINFQKEIEIKFTFEKPKFKPKFNSENALRIIFSLNNNYEKYFKIINNKNKFSKKNNLILWIRGGDRKFNVKKFEEIVKERFASKDFTVLTNDKFSLKNYPLLKNKFIEGSPLKDFQSLLETKIIISQFSGFSLSPFLLSKLHQTIFLISKENHSKEEFPYIDNDWEFLMTLLNELNNINPHKKFTILN